MFNKRRRKHYSLPTTHYSLNPRGFTLIELLTVILIIAILSIAGMVVYTNVDKRTKDSLRVGDLTNINQVIMTVLSEAGTIDANLLCGTGNPFPCRGSTYPIGTNTRKIDSTGWIKINFVGQNNVSFSANSLPVDPTNDSTYHYTYCASGNQWEVNATLAVNDQNKMQNDGGDDPNKYEIGTNMSLINVVSGCNY
jgi:prepilin-type N-terminal cleavage/methylation domain-containing protein